jgi:glycosyltransferase involved in cell wall biosynthesis
MKALYSLHADAYLFFAFTSPILFFSKGIYNTIHDMGAWDAAQAMKPFQKLYWRVSYRICAKVSKCIFTVSNFSKQRIADILKYDPNKIEVVSSAVSANVVDLSRSDFPTVKKKYSLPDKYILSLSTLEPRKNLSLLLEAYSQIQDQVDYDLVLVGRKGWKMEDVLEKYNSQKRIHITGFVEDEDVAHIYKNALCFVFPSLYEGFGLPPVEALTLQTPVLASNAASIPEVLMDQAIYFENNSKQELKDKLLHLNESAGSMPRGLNEYQKKHYSFPYTAKRILEVVES